MTSQRLSRRSRLSKRRGATRPITQKVASIVLYLVTTGVAAGAGSYGWASATENPPSSPTPIEINIDDLPAAARLLDICQLLDS